jgi:hypothetical protein
MRLFDKLYSATKEAIDTMKKPIVESRTKRKLASAFDSAEEQRLDAEHQLSELRQNFDSYDVNEILAQKAKVAAAEVTKKAVSEEHFEMFGEELK